jgi:Leucine-rich repeat (LRR) protein
MKIIMTNILLLSLLLSGGLGSEAVDVTHQRTSPTTSAACPWGCTCTSVTASEAVVNCTSNNLTQPPIPIEDSTASNLLLPKNGITHVDLVFLKHYPSLKLLDLGQNGLRSLSKSVDAPIFSLVHLDLSDNHLHVIHAYVLSSFPGLKSLNLSGNGLHTVSQSAFALPALQTLDLSRNKLPIGKLKFVVVKI